MRQEIRRVANDLKEFAVGSGREDLVSKLDQELALHDSPEAGGATLVVIGAVSRGKSSLVNNLMGAELLPTDVDVVGGGYAMIRQGAVTGVREMVQGMDARGMIEGGAETILSYHEQRKLGVEATEVMWQDPLLEKGLVLVDTPGYGGLNPAQDAMTTMALRLADAVMLVVDSSAPISSSELDLLSLAGDRVATCLVVMTKTDTAPQWRELKAENERALSSLAGGFPDLKVIPVSSRVHAAAAVARKNGQPELADQIEEESGFRELREAIDRQVLARAEQLEDLNLIRYCGRMIDALGTLDEIEAEADQVVSEEEAATLRGRLDELTKLRQTIGDKVNAASRALIKDVAITVPRRTAETTLAWQAKIDSEADIDLEWLPERIAQAISQVAVELSTDAQEAFSRSAEELFEEISSTEIRVPGVLEPRFEDLSVLALPDMNPATSGLEGGIGSVHQKMMQTYIMAGAGGMLGTAVPVIGNLVGFGLGAAAGLTISLVTGAERKQKLEAQAKRGAAKQYASQAINEGMATQVRPRLDEAIPSAYRELAQTLFKEIDDQIGQINVALGRIGEARKEDSRKREVRQKAAQERLVALRTFAGQIGEIKKSLESTPPESGVPLSPSDQVPRSAGLSSLDDDR